MSMRCWRGSPAGYDRPYADIAAQVNASGLVDAAHDAELAGDAISFAGLSDPPPGPPGPAQLPGQMTLDEALAENAQEEL